MEQYHKNPRVISTKELEELKANIEKLGDLSGITHDLTTDEIITGNQRSKIINVNDCQKEIIEQYEEPDKQGTVAWGYIIWDGQRLNYRQVIWNAKQIEKANITANKLGGEFDLVMLQHFNEKDLLQWGFKDYELFDFGIIDKAGESGLLRKSIRDISEDFSLTLHFNKKDQHLVEAFCKETGKKKMTEFIINHLKTQPNA